MAHDDPYSGRTVYADWAYDLSRATTYTPTLTATTTNPDLGADGSITGWYHRAGHWITGGVLIHFSGTGLSAGSGTYQVSLPLAADLSLLSATTTAGAADILGDGFIRDNGTTANSTVVQIQLVGASTVRLKPLSATAHVTDSSPFTWATDDRIAVRFAYPADPSVL